MVKRIYERRVIMYYSRGRPYYMSQQISPQTPEPPSCPGGSIYTVRPGDTLYRIANQYGVSLQQLLAANPQITNPNVIFVDQPICVPGVLLPPPSPPQPFCPDGIVYAVRRGDTLYNIARRFGVTIQSIIQANPQIADPNVLEIGQRVCVPAPETPLPEGICRVCLTPQRQGVLGATAFINYADPTVWITTFGLPAPTEVGAEYSIYRAWLVDRDGGNYFRIELNATGLPGIEAGYRKGRGDFTIYDEIIITAERSPAPQRPTGPILLRESLERCR